ncbi:MAG: hypothetical protein JXQ75_07835 [Phycisphaerae bacterium]|nr:hypothetical protein [Phycisphaerae bacterium]
MATVGHTLVGLSLSNLSRATSRGQALRYVWPGLIVLLAHVVDIVEWMIVLVAPEYFNQHFVTNSPFVTAGIVAVAWLVLFVGTRLRRPWPYILVALAVFSHLLLDYDPVRIAVADTYSRSADAELPGLCDAVIAEVWLYGLLLVSVGLVQAARQHDCPRRGRAAAGVLGVLAIFAAITRSPGLWMPAYVLAVLHTLLLSRRHLTLRLLWSLVPLVPLFMLLAVESWAGRLFDQATMMKKDRNYAGAAEMYERALAVPTRSCQLGAFVYLSQCQRQLGDLAGAEATLLRAIRRCEQPHWARLGLAALYMDPQVRGTPCYRPQEAARILRGMIDGQCPSHIVDRARRMLEDLHHQGLAEP